jgi:hypothetical protein
MNIFAATFFGVLLLSNVAQATTMRSFLPGFQIYGSVDGDTAHYFDDYRLFRSFTPNNGDYMTISILRSVPRSYLPHRQVNIKLELIRCSTGQTLPNYMQVVNETDL